MWYPVLEIIQKTTGELGLAQPATVVSNTDTTVVQLRNLLTALGEELATNYNWTALQKEHTITTVIAQAAYTLPTDYSRVINETQWDRTRNNPLTGPLLPSEYAKVKTDTGNKYSFRIKGNQIVLHPTPDEETTITLEYMSNAFVIDANDPAARKREIEHDGDKLIYDDRLIINGLKLKFKEANGLSTATATYDYEQTLSSVYGNDAGASTLSLTKRAALAPLDAEWRF